ncbi:MAG: hypothetical protein VX460_08465 [Planctomycetota bacterium]|nr:hypothetical protein [Planctomycetota bacterium]
MSERDQTERARVEEFLALDDDGLKSSLEAHFSGDGASREVAGFADLCRGALAPELCEHANEADERGSSVFRERRVAERVMARSTREDLRRRADVGLVIDFIGERLRQSALLRVAAALLLVQLTLVPLVALHLARDTGDRGLRFRLEPAPEVFESLPERDEDYEVEGGIGAVGDPLAVEDLLGELLTALVGTPSAEPVTDEGESLAALEAVLRGGRSLGERSGASPLVIWADLEARLILWQDGGGSSGLAKAIDDATAALAGADASGRALLTTALRRAAGMHLAVPALPESPGVVGVRGALGRCLEGIDDPVAERWRRALQR